MWVFNFLLTAILGNIVYPVGAQTESFCETFAIGTAPSNFSPSPEEDYPGPFYLRVYVHILQTTDIQGQPIISQTSVEIEHILNILNADFNPHNIYFVPVCEVDTISVSLIEYGGEFCNFNTTNRHSDGIDIFLLDDDLAYGRGRAESIPGTMFYIKGRFSIPPFTPLPPSHVTSHEMGHCLGLWHTHHGTRPEPGICPPDCQENGLSDPNQCPELVDGSNSATCGDLVVDTPADPLFFYTNVDENCQWNGLIPALVDCNGNSSIFPSTDANGMLYQPDVSNIMAVTSPDCMQYFTQGQGKRMRKTIAEAPVLQNCLINPASGVVTEISSNTQFDADMDMPGDIIVRSGAELRIKARIGMPQESRVLVERNARLTIDADGVLTRACGTHHWKGVQVQGNKQMVQPEHWGSLTNPDQAGIVWVNGGTIEWALKGVSAGSGQESAFWGGLVRTANSAKFLNNQIDVELMPFKPFPTVQNKSWFSNTLFTELGASFDNTEGVIIRETEGISFDHCTFRNKDREGIRTFDASIFVHNQSRFENNETGISSFATVPMSNATRIGSAGTPENEFSNNKYHVNASLSTGIPGVLSDGKFSMEIINNKFEGGDYGVILEGASNFRIAGNLFAGINIGNCITNTGFNNLLNQNLVGCNTFKDGSQYGIQVVGENRQMQFLANDFQMGNGSEDFLLTNSFFPVLNGAIRATQGNKNAAAANCFTSPGQQVDIQTWGSTEPFTYFHQTTPSTDCDPVPQTLGNYSIAPVLGEVSSINCYHYGGLPDGLTNPTLEDLTTRRAILMQLAPNVSTNPIIAQQYYRTMQEKDAILSYLLKQALATEQYTMAEGLLIGEQNKAADWAILGLRIARKDFLNATTWLNSLPIQSGEDQAFRTIQLTNLQRLQNPGVFQLNENQELFLNALADGASPVRGYARGLLGLLHNHRYYPDRLDLLGERDFSTQKPTPNDQGQIRVFPNPATMSVSVSLPPFPEGADSHILLYDLYGKQQMNKRITPMVTQQTLEIGHLPNGVYLLIITEGGNTIHQNKLSIQH